MPLEQAPATAERADEVLARIRTVPARAYGYLDASGSGSHDRFSDFLAWDDATRAIAIANGASPHAIDEGGGENGVG